MNWRDGKQGEDSRGRRGEGCLGEEILASSAARHLWGISSCPPFLASSLHLLITAFQTRGQKWVPVEPWLRPSVFQTSSSLSWGWELTMGRVHVLTKRVPVRDHSLVGHSCLAHRIPVGTPWGRNGTPEPHRLSGLPKAHSGRRSSGGLGFWVCTEMSPPQPATYTPSLGPCLQYCILPGPQ